MEVLNFKQLCSGCGKEIEEQFNQDLTEKQKQLHELNEYLKYIDLIRQKHLICKQLEIMKTVGLTYRDLIVILQDRTKLSKSTIKKILIALQEFNDTEFDEKIEAIESLISKLQI